MVTANIMLPPGTLQPDLDTRFACVSKHGVVDEDASVGALIDKKIADKTRAGNVHVNHNIIVAIAGVQAIGDQGFPGAGPKTGGQQYQLRFANEKTVTIDPAALGGNTSLLALGDE